MYLVLFLVAFAGVAKERIAVRHEFGNGIFSFNGPIPK